MSNELSNFYPLLREALQNGPVEWTPQCPDPENLLDWIERGENYPQSQFLLDHLIGCAYCRRERAVLIEVRALSPARPRTPQSARQAKWIQRRVDELVTTGIAVPARAMRAVLETLQRIAFPSPLAATRSAAGPTRLWPDSTVIRTLQPILRWSDPGVAQSYSVVVFRQMGWKKPYLVWSGNSASEQQLVLPDQGCLEPGGVYRWQVSGWAGDQEIVSEPACFAVLTAQAASQLEELEQQSEEGTLERIGIYEAFGLYTEALHQAEKFAAAPEGRALAKELLARLREQLSL